MPTYQGQTDQVLKIQLPSAILNARWGANEVAMGGRIMLEVNTQWVADGSEIEIRVKDFEGGPIETLQGKVFANIHRRQYMVAKANKTGGMFFEAELKAHGLKVVGPKVKVGPPVAIQDLKWTDADGKTRTEIRNDEGIILSAKIQGPKDGTMAGISILSKMESRPPRLIKSFEKPISNGRVTGDWIVEFPGDTVRIPPQTDLDKDGLKYEQPSLFFQVQCLGTKAVSPEIKWMDWIEFDFGPQGEGMPDRTAIFELPDGKEHRENVPEDGKIKLDSSLPGQVIFKGFADG